MPCIECQGCDVTTRPFLDRISPFVFAGVYSRGLHAEFVRCHIESLQGNYFWQTEDVHREVALIEQSLENMERISKMPMRKRDARVCAEEEEIPVLIEASLKTSNCLDKLIIL